MERQGVVRGLVLDSAVLFEVDSSGSLKLVPDAPRFLLRLQYSNLLLGVLLHDDCQELISRKEAVLEEVGVVKTLDLVTLNLELTARDALQNLGSLWGIPSTSLAYVTGQQAELTGREIFDQGWKIIQFGSGNNESGAIGAFTTVDQLQAILVVLSNLNKLALGPSIVVVGHTMKWSRELDFLKRGALPMVPNKFGLTFVPIQLDQPLKIQLSAVDVILHKATDETLTISSEKFGYPGSVQFSKGIRDLERYILDNPHICVVDPLNQVLPLLDRIATQAILQNLRIPGQQIVRSPRCVEVTTFKDPWLSQALESENVSLPAIVKPRIACGVSEAHTMAVIFKKEGFNNLAVPLPASIQEYIDHGAFQYKIYVLGKSILHSCRRSTPNAAVLASSNNGAPSVIFDSLKSLPMDVVNENCGEENSSSRGELNLEAVRAAAKELGQILGLSLFGFDIVVQAGTNDYVIVDVNYFPSFKDVPDIQAIPAFWQALITTHHERMS